MRPRLQSFCLTFAAWQIDCLNTWAAPSSVCKAADVFVNRVSTALVYPAKRCSAAGGRVQHLCCFQELDRMRRMWLEAWTAPSEPDDEQGPPKGALHCIL